MFSAESGQFSESFYTLVKAVGESSGRNEQRRIIRNERDLLREEMRCSSVKHPKEQLLRALYCEMLGQDASFAFVKAVNLAQCSRSLIAKRTGYLFCGLCLSPASEFNLLLVNSIRKDLEDDMGRWPMLVSALAACSNLRNRELLSAVMALVYELLRHDHPHVRRRALICYPTFILNLADEVPDLIDVIKRGLADPDPSVMVAALPLLSAVVEAKLPAAYELGPPLASILDQVLLARRLDAKNNYHGVPPPWLIAKVVGQLEGLEMLHRQGHGESIILDPRVLPGSGASDVAGLFRICLRRLITQCTETVSYGLAAEFASALCRLDDSLAAGTVKEFICICIQSDHKLLRITALRLIEEVIVLDPDVARDHGEDIITSLEDMEECVRARALALITRVTNSTNFDSILDRLLTGFETQTEKTFRERITESVVEMAFRFAPNESSLFASIMRLALKSREHMSSRVYGLLTDEILSKPDEFSSAVEQFLASNELRDIAQSTNLWMVQLSDFLKCISEELNIPNTLSRSSGIIELYCATEVATFASSLGNVNGYINPPTINWETAPVPLSSSQKNYRPDSNERAFGDWHRQRDMEVLPCYPDKINLYSDATSVSYVAPVVQIGDGVGNSIGPSGMGRQIPVAETPVRWGRPRQTERSGEAVEKTKAAAKELFG